MQVSQYYVKIPIANTHDLSAEHLAQSLARPSAKQSLSDLNFCPLVCLMPFFEPKDVNSLGRMCKSWKIQLFSTPSTYPFYSGKLSHLVACYVRNKIFDKQSLYNPIYNCFLIKNIKKLEHFEKIKEFEDGHIIPFLNVRHFYWTTSPLPNGFQLEAFKALNSLTLTEQTQCFPSNESIESASLPAPIDCQLMSNFLALQILTFKDCCNMENTNLSALAELPALKGIIFSQCHNIPVLNLVNIASLKYLSFTHSSLLNNFELGNLDKLQALCINIHPQFLEQIEEFNLYKLKELRYLSISNIITNINQLHKLNSLTNLEHLRLFNIKIDDKEFDKLKNYFPALQYVSSCSIDTFGVKNEYEYGQYVESSGRQFEKTAEKTAFLVFAKDEFDE